MHIYLHIYKDAIVEGYTAQFLRTVLLNYVGNSGFKKQLIIRYPILFYFPLHIKNLIIIL